MFNAAPSFPWAHHTMMWAGGNLELQRKFHQEFPSGKGGNDKFKRCPLAQGQQQFQERSVPFPAV